MEEEDGKIVFPWELFKLWRFRHRLVVEGGKRLMMVATVVLCIVPLFIELPSNPMSGLFWGCVIAAFVLLALGILLVRCRVK